jgi:uncharacterized YigZ family protein
LSNSSFIFQTISERGFAEFKDRGSKFLASCFPIQSIDEFKIELKKIKEQHPKAVHFCSAYRIGFDGNIYRASDDGEPSGSAGKPILGQIDSNNITNVAIVIVRYFGGTLLGVPGLIYAYKTSASLAINSVSIIQKPILVHYKLQFNYTQMNDIMKIVKQFDCIIENQEMQLFCLIQLAAPLKFKQEVEAKILDLRDVEFSLV